jgi:hypothetical protein
MGYGEAGAAHPLSTEGPGEAGGVTLPTAHLPGEARTADGERIGMAAREQTYRCVGGPCDGMFHTVVEEKRIRLSPLHDAAPLASGNSSSLPLEVAADYDVRRLLAQDGKWHEFLVLSAWTSMQATVWLNRRR